MRTIKLNWAAILAFSTFWTYAFYAALSGENKAIFASNSSILFFICSTALLSGIFVFFSVLYFYKNDAFKDELKYTNTDKNVLVLYTTSMLLLSMIELTNEISGDAFAHSKVAFMHAATTTYILFKLFPFIENIDFRDVLFVINIILLIGFGFFLYVIKKLATPLNLILCFLAFVLCRFAVIYLGGGFQDVHPPLRVLPIWLSSSIFYPSNFSVRLPQFLGLIALMFLSFKFASKHISNTKAILFGLTIGTIPMLWHVGILVEQSIWSSLCVTYLLYCLLNKAFDANYTFNLLRVSAVVSIGILLRQPNFVCLFLLAAIFAYSHYFEKKISLKKTLIYLSPLLFALPFISKSVFFGTSATDSIGGLKLGQVIFSITSKAGLYSMLNGALYWIIFIPFILLLYKKNKIISFLILLFLLVDYTQFYLIKPILWGGMKYQAEYVIPFTIIGFFLFIYYCFDNKYVYLPVFAFLIVSDIFIFKNISHYNKPIDELKNNYFEAGTKPFGSIIISEFVSPYNQALSAVKSAGYSKNVYLYGVIYGVEPQILANYSVNEVAEGLRVFEMVKREVLQRHWSVDLNFWKKTFHDNKNIKIILFSDLPDLPIINCLKANGWSHWKSFSDEKYKTKIVGLIRNSEL